jgi:hypothetical protein
VRKENGELLLPGSGGKGGGEGEKEQNQRQGKRQTSVFREHTKASSRILLSFCHVFSEKRKGNFAPAVLQWEHSKTGAKKC